MQHNLNNIEYVIGNENVLKNMRFNTAKISFSSEAICFFNELSKGLLTDKEARKYSDIVTLAFWLRRASLEKQKLRFEIADNIDIRLGRGIAFHIAPSNVAVNYAYSFAISLLMGNFNIVRLPSKAFAQVEIINRMIKEILINFPDLEKYICFIKYGHDKKITDYLSVMCDVRIIWGGDLTISQIRESKLKPRAIEITFADRYSICVIDAQAFLDIRNQNDVINKFYNDTYLFDQNACTSPRVIVWVGGRVEEAQEKFWSLLNKKVLENYQCSSIQIINKLVLFCITAAKLGDVKIRIDKNNMLMRVQILKLDEETMAYYGNSGYFLEYVTDDIESIKNICSEKCQTISYIGNSKMFTVLLNAGVRGIDRIVPVGRTSEFDFIWDGHVLVERLSRTIQII